ANDLTDVGFRIAGVPTTSSGPRITTTVIRFGPSRADSARTLAAAVPGATLQQDTGLGSTIELVVGTNYHGARHVTVTAAPAAAPKVQTRTASDNPCS